MLGRALVLGSVLLLAVAEARPRHAGVSTELEAALRRAATRPSRRPAQGTIDPFEVRFSQDHICTVFADGRPLATTIADLRAGRLALGAIPPIKVVDLDGQLFTLDNRRLYAFQQAGRPIAYCLVPAREALRQLWKFTTRNAGRSVELHAPGQPLRRTPPTGSR